MNYSKTAQECYQPNISDGRIKRSFKVKISGYSHAKTLYVTISSNISTNPFFPFSFTDNIFLTLESGNIIVTKHKYRIRSVKSSFRKHIKARTLYLTFPVGIVSSSSFPFKKGDIVHLIIDPKNRRLVIAPIAPIRRNLKRFISVPSTDLEHVQSLEPVNYVEPVNSSDFSSRPKKTGYSYSFIHEQSENNINCMQFLKTILIILSFVLFLYWFFPYLQ
ncbi:MAG: hypothetical protein ACTSPH_07895 [Promethearchaeota archaeon]